MGDQSGVSPEVLPLPKGGGAVRSIGETFSPDLHTGTGSYRIPLRFLPGPGGFQPEMALVYSSGGGNGPFGLGWLLPVMQLARRTDAGLPTYDDGADTFVLDHEELIALGVDRYRHRREEQFRRIERSGDGWEVRDRSGRRFLLGTTPAARIEDTQGGVTRTYAWLIERAVDRNGNEVRYEYLRDGGQLYVQSVRYGIYRTDFVYEPRTDVTTQRRAGFDVTTALRCARIEFWIDGASDPLFRRYTLAYDECPYTGISQLSTVTVSGHRGAETAALPPVRLSYTAFRPGHRLVSFASLTGDPPPDSLANPELDLLDLYGTGLPGVIQLNGSARRFWPNAGGGQWGPPASLRRLPASAALGKAAVAFADMNGDGAADLVSLEDRPFGYYRNEPGVGFTAKQRFRTAPSIDPRDPQVRFIDVDGDGVVDAMRSGERALYFYVNRGDAGWAEPFAVTRIRDLARFPDVSFSDPRVKLADMTGDGLTDIVWVHGSALEWWPHYGNGRFGARITVSIDPPLGPRFDPERLFLSDVNGDGAADLVYVEADTVRLWLNRDGRALVDGGTIPFTPQATASNVRLADMMGTGTLGLVWSYAPATLTARNYKVLDFTGGVRPYLLRSIDDGTGLVTEIDYRPSTEHSAEAAREHRPWKSALPFPVHVVTRLTERDTITGAAVRRAIRYFDGSFDGASRTFRGFGRAEVLEQGDSGTPSTLTKSYFHQGAGELGDERALTGKLLRVEVFGPDGTAAASRPFRIEENTYATRVIETGVGGARAVFPHLVETRVSVSERGEASVTSRSSLFYDGFGNVVRKEDEWDAAGGKQRLVTRMAYTADEVRWILNLPVELSREDGDSGTLLALTRFYYDGAPFTGLPAGQAVRGNLARREAMVLTDAVALQVYGVAPPDFAALAHHRMTGPGGVQGWGVNAERSDHDAFGNVIARMDALGNRGTIAFGPDHTYAIGVTDALGHAFEAEYDPLAGELRRLRDPNGSETRYRFDALGRLIAMVKPGDSDALPTVLFEHLDGALPLGVRTRLRERAGDPAVTESVEYFDGFKRTVQRRSSAEGGQVLVDAFRAYDARGWESLHTAMFFSTGFAYAPGEGAADPRRYVFRRDALGRIVETTTPDGAASRLVYEAGRVTTYDVSDTDASPANVARGHFDTPQVTEFDAQGRLLAVVEDTGSAKLTTRYARDAMGRLTSITDARGIETARYRHDLLGRKIEADHVDTGRRRVVFDGRGDIAESVDASGRTVAMRYDALRRVIETVVEGALVERFFYDTGNGANLVGRLARVEDEAGSQEISYTPRGVVASRTREVPTVSGPASFTVGFQYDSLDRMTRVTRPGGAAVDYEYNARSLVRRIPDVIDAIDYNELGQRTRTRFANGVEQVDAFDPLTFYLQRSRITGPARVEPYLDVTFRHDRAGNPLEITDEVTAAGHVAYQRQFSYDATFRLTRSEGTLSGAAFQHAFSYDEAGNFRRNEEFAPEDLYLAPGGGNRIRGVESGGTQVPLFDHDANGNLTSTPDGTLHFDARGRLRTVVRNDGTRVEFLYDYQGQRVRKRVISSGGTSETLYVDGVLEVRDGQATEFVFHKDARVAAVGQQGTTWFHHDHLGNLVLMTDQAGGIVQELGYRAFGAVAFNSTGSSPPLAFLGNEADVETGLVYCQARYYDPRIGRFVTPDLVFLLNPEKVLASPSSLNLYAYAGNNPVKLVDREGAWWKWVVGALVIAALVVATIVVGVATGGAGFAFGILLMASIGSALGAGIGTYSAWRAGGNLEDGFLVGAIVGGLAGAAGYAVGAAVAGAAAGLSGAWGAVLAGAAEGAILGAANGAIIGYGGGTGDWKDILIQAGVGALVGAVLGGLAGYVSYISTQGGAIAPGTFEKALGTGPGGYRTAPAFASAGRALDTSVRSTLNTIISATARPMVYVSLGSAHHAAVYHDWDAIKAWILETFGGEKEEVIVNVPGGGWG